MLEARRDADLAQKAFGADHRAELGPQDLERNAALVTDVACKKDGRHSAGTDLPLDRVSAA